MFILRTTILTPDPLAGFCSGTGEACKGAFEVAAKLTWVFTLGFPGTTWGLPDAIPPCFLSSESGPIVDRLTKAGDKLAGEGWPDVPTEGGVFRPPVFWKLALSEVLPLKKVLKLPAQDEPLVEDPAEDP